MSIKLKYWLNYYNPRGWRPGPPGLGCQPRGLNPIIIFEDLSQDVNKETLRSETSPGR
jgi:hypothetical protein